MSDLFCFALAAGIAFAISALVKAFNVSHASLSRSGRPARGILLEVNPIATRVPGSTTYPVERRTALVEVELPGQAPVEVRTTLLIPLNLSALVLPGATVELRLPASSMNTLAVVGPGSGFAIAGLVPVVAPAPASLPGRPS